MSVSYNINKCYYCPFLQNFLEQLKNITIIFDRTFLIMLENLIRIIYFYEKEKRIYIKTF